MSRPPQISVLMILFTAWVARAADRFVIVDEGRPACSIVLSASASPAEKRGAEELRSYVKQISGAELSIVTDAQPLPEHSILVGRSRASDALGLKLDDLGDEGFVIRTTDHALALVGPGKRGSLYACTTLLEKLGVRWLTPSVTRVPSEKTITVDAIDQTQVPAFEYREPFFTESFDRDWAARLKMNGQSMRLDESTGGKIEYFQFVHTMDLLVPRNLYATHSEYFPLINGKRAEPGYEQRCLSNPEVLKLAIEHVRQWIKEAPNAKIYSVSQNDTYKWCECDECKAIEARYGGTHSGLYLWFANQVAEAIEKDHPDKLIDTLAYQFTEDPPSGIAPRRNVRVRLCPIACCDAHPYEQCNAKANVQFMQHLRGWAAITDTLYIWHYNTDFANYLLPFPDFDEFPAEIRLYKKSGVKGIFFEGDVATGGGGSDAELRCYVMAHQLWDPTLDTKSLVADWMHGVYGAAAEPMQKWFDLLHDQVRNPNQHLFIWTDAKSPIFSGAVVSQGDAYFDQAEKLAMSDPVANDYVAKARLSLRFVKLMQHPTRGEEYTRFVADLERRGITSIKEGQPLADWERDYLKQIDAAKN